MSENDLIIAALFASPLVTVAIYIGKDWWNSLRRWTRARARHRLRTERAARLRTPVRQRLKRRRVVLTASPALRRAANDL